MTTSPIRIRLHAIELAEQYWEHDRLTLRTLTPAQRAAQVHARERLVRHARRVQHLVETGQIPAGDGQQRGTADAVADLLQMLLEHALDGIVEVPQPARATRVPIPAPPEIWTDSAQPRSAPPATDAAPAVASCRRCMGRLVRDPLATALCRPPAQGWRHADGRKTHHPEPVIRPESASSMADQAPQQ